MKLLYSNTSPFARKVRLLILEKGITEQIELVVCNPFDEAVTLATVNPLGKIPVLILKDGSALYDSSVICAYLDALYTSVQLIPDATTRAHWQVRRWEALADGIMEAAVHIVMERRRPDGEQSQTWIKRWFSQISQSLDTAENTLEQLPEAISLAQLALVAALAYLSFRLPDYEWIKNHSKLNVWYTSIADRTAIQQTEPLAI